MLNRINKIDTKKLLVIFLIFYFIIFSSASIIRHISMQTGLFDFALETQVIRKTSELKLFESGVEVPNYLGDHFSPLPILTSAVVYKIIPNDFIIQILQVLLVVIGLYYFFKLYLSYSIKPHVSLLFTILLGLVPGIQSAILVDYHPIIYAFPILIAAIYYDKKGKLLLSLGLFFLACFVKEDVGIFVAGYGILQVLEKKKVGILLIIIGLGITYLSMFYIIPTIRGEMTDSLSRYSQFGTNVVEIVKNIVLKPLETIKYLATTHNLKYILILFIPFLFLPLIKLKEIVFLFLPLFALNIFSNFQIQSGGIHHYDIVISVTLGYSLILGWIKLQSNENFKKRLNKIFIILFIIVVLLLPFYKLTVDLSRFTNERYSDYLELKSITKDIDKKATIGVTNTAGGHLSTFDNVFIIYPEWVNYENTNFDYILVYLKEIPDNFIKDSLEKYREYSQIYTSSSYMLLKK